MSTRKFFSPNQPQTISTAFPAWFPFFTTDGSGNLQANFFPGTVGGILPSNIFTPLAVSQTLTTYIYLAMTATAGNLTGASIGSNTTGFAAPPAVTSGSPPTSFQIPLAVLIPTSTLIQNVVGFGNIWVQPYVDLFDTINTGAILTAPFTPWYGWLWGAGS